MFDKALNTLLWYEDDNGFNVTLLSQTQEHFSVWFVGKSKKRKMLIDWKLDLLLL